mmetsp:Transcript_13876/g.21143  ORF Transcript_13876/g.21143 Transcript_13876/m.21143 type:complete len:179 (+) Transcript_13876:359-895(+)|eukprot:CAMPEP_0178916712 /NCGR_PEP_ID=MMETSP0786-20121207/12810_1 /TAXON_ID=186022 /ORGANISM="Thalassionema frauenfeldii, Strain CCMP 1798" /LENGTH=178 /DNA_ID=CAMNT_0020590115 /DNA_START=347 /DNA_END=883 /DNA_ORIENTATION=-
MMLPANDGLLLEAVQMGNLTVVRALLNNRGRKNSATGSSSSSNGDWSLLHLAAFQGSAEMTELLLEHGYHPNVEDSNGKTPLHWASLHCHEHIMQHLLRHRADPNHATGGGDGNTPLHWAVQYGNDAIVNILLQHGANPRIPNNDYQSPLSLARRHGRRAIVLQLLKHRLQEASSIDC